MSEEQIALARRAVACEGWRWTPGMLRTSPGAHHGIRVLDVNAVGIDRTHPLPDLTDAATLGCLLALVREAHGRCCYTQVCGGYWTIQNDDTEDAWGDHCATEAEALVAALEAAPKRGDHRREEKP